MNLERITKQYNKELETSTEGYEYLCSRGFTRHDYRFLINDFRLGYSFLNKSDYYYGYLIFPIIYQNKVRSFTGRSILDNITPIHKHWGGKIDYFYNHDVIFKINNRDTIIITESPLDSLSLNCVGFNSIATMGGSRLPSFFKDLKDRNIVILFDTDHNNSGKRNANSLASKLHGIPNLIQIAEIPMKIGLRKIDVNDLYRHYDDKEGFRNIIFDIISEAVIFEAEKKVKKSQKKLGDNNFNDRYDIFSVISDHVDLQAVGGLYKGICPFHNDSDPSFTVYPWTSSWYCFGCSSGGDVISFVEKLMSLDFKETKKYLEATYG